MAVASRTYLTFELAVELLVGGHDTPLLLEEATGFIRSSKPIVAAVNPAWKPFTTVIGQDLVDVLDGVLVPAFTGPGPFKVDVHLLILVEDLLDEVSRHP